MGQKISSVLGNPIEISWLNLWPVTQVYGIFFNKEKEVLVLKRPDGRYTLPGGKPETGENIYETLIREAMEEANVEVEDLVLLGANQVDDPQNPDPKFKQYFQIRIVGKIKKELQREIDPATNELMERQYYSVEELNNILNWGENGEEMVKLIKKFLEFQTSFF